jgi:hypothetical protein
LVEGVDSRELAFEVGFAACGDCAFGNLFALPTEFQQGVAFRF